MKTGFFLDTLRRHGLKTLQFEFAPGEFVPANYHITEIKNTTIESVDCGGAMDSWNETVVQLWVANAGDESHRVNCGKAMKIFDVVDKMRPMDRDAEIKFEYGDNRDIRVSHYTVHEINEEQNMVTVSLFPSTVQCKGIERAKASGKEGACGTPVREEKSRQLELVGCCGTEESSACCS